MPSPRPEELSPRRSGFWQAGAVQRADEVLGRVGRELPALKHVLDEGSHDGQGHRWHHR